MILTLFSNRLSKFPSKSPSMSSSSSDEHDVSQPSAKNVKEPRNKRSPNPASTGSTESDSDIVERLIKDINSLVDIYDNLDESEYISFVLEDLEKYT